MSLTTICFKVHDPDLAIVEALEAHEQLNRSDILRRAIRAYAKSLGLLDNEGQPKKSKRK